MSDSVGGLPEQQSPKAARLQDLIQKLTDDPELARPSRFCPAMLEIATGRPLVAALQRHDHDLLGILAAHPRSVGLHGPEHANRQDITSAAADIVQFLREGRAAALRLIDPPGGNR